jgi:probable rRNA maturation factor
MKSDPLITFRRKPATLDAESLQSFAEVLRDRVAGGHEFHCRITNDAELQSLNAQFRGNNYVTDVLSFPVGQVGNLRPICNRPARFRAQPVPRDKRVPIGDIAISIQRARVQSRECRHSTEEELRILMLHGVLHLLGMDHETDSGQMKRAETHWRKKLGLPAGLTERMTEGDAR